MTPPQQDRKPVGEAHGAPVPRVVLQQHAPELRSQPPDGPDTLPATEPPQPIRHMGKIVGSGMALMIIATVANKAMTMLAQWVLGAKLSPEDFAVFAYATAIAGFTMVCREAGVRELLVQRGEKEYENLAGTGFWLALAWNLLVSAIMAAIALPVSRLLRQPLLAPMLWVIAAALPIGTIGGILQTSMRLHLRFRDFAVNNLTSSFARQGSMIAMALGGMGAMSQAWPVLVGTIAEAGGAFLRSRDALWRRPMEVRRWPGLLRQSKWLMFASVANFAVDWGPFLLMAGITALSHAQSGILLRLAKAFALTDKEAGFFYFAFMITAQVGVLLSFNLSLVLTPALARLNDEPERLASGVLRSLRTLMLAGSIGSLGLACVIEPLQALLWPGPHGDPHGKWFPAVGSVIILGAFFPWRITFGVSSSMLQAQGRFRLYALLTAIEGGGLTLFTILGAWTSPTATSMSWWAGGWLLVSRLVLTIWVMRSIRVPVWDVLMSTFPAWLAALAATATALACVHFIPYKQLIGSTHPRVYNAVSVLVAGTTCALVFTLICRTMLKSHLVEVLSVSPARLRPIAARLLLLPEPP